MTVEEVTQQPPEPILGNLLRWPILGILASTVAGNMIRRPVGLVPTIANSRTHSSRARISNSRKRMEELVQLRPLWHGRLLVPELEGARLHRLSLPS